MEHPIIQIKNAITALLKGIDPDTDVFYEEIKGTEEKHGLDEPETYYFVDIIPNGNETVDRFFTDMGVLVDIAYHEKIESNTAYLIKGAEIDAVVRPVFSFGDRNIMILSILVDTFISKISFPMQPGPEIGSISDA